MGKGITKPDIPARKAGVSKFLKDRAAGVIYHIRKNPVMWISLAAFMLFASLFTSSICVFRSIFGIPCPGCGLTRAVLAAMQGNFSAAFSAHPLFILAAAALIAIIVMMAIKPKLLSSRPASITWILLSAVFIIVYIYRMIVYFPAAEPLTFNANAFVPRILRLLGSLVDWLRIN